MSAYRDPAGTAGAPISLRRPIALCARGDMPPNVALVHIAMAARDAPDVESILRGAEARLATKDPTAAHRIRRALELWRRNPGAFATISGILEVVGQTADLAGIAAVSQWTAIFNRAASISPEASVALYSLGNPDLLRATTDEVVDWMKARALLGGTRRVLEIGCGIGRFALALAPYVRLLAGIDISSRMLQIARAHCAALSNVSFVLSSGKDLSVFADESFDLVYAVDAFPYFVHPNPSLAERHFHEARRVLNPGGRFLVLNYSYRGDLARDRGDVERLARTAGLTMFRNGSEDFLLWDGASFLLGREE
jgi:SAM-dependent methyltransferase